MALNRWTDAKPHRQILTNEKKTQSAAVTICACHARHRREINRQNNISRNSAQRQNSELNYTGIDVTGYYMIMRENEEEERSDARQMGQQQQVLGIRERERER